MNRRQMLGWLGTAAAAATLDPEELLWRPGAKLISIPARRIVQPVMLAYRWSGDAGWSVATNIHIQWEQDGPHLNVRKLLEIADDVEMRVVRKEGSNVVSQAGDHATVADRVSCIGAAE